MTHKLWRLFSTLVCFCMLAVIFSSAALAQNGRVVRVGYYLYNGFQEHEQATDIYSGYSYEYLMNLAQYTGWTYEFVPCTFTDSLQKLETGEIDLVNNVNRTSEREEHFAFSALPSGENCAYLITRPNNKSVGFDDFSSFGTIKIGLSQKSIFSQPFIKLCQEHNCAPNIIWYNSNEAVVHAYESNQVDAMVIASTNKMDFHLLTKFFPHSYYIALPKNKPELLKELNCAMESLRTSDPFLNSRLQAKYYGTNTENSSFLTKDERAYLEENPIATVAYTSDWYPLSYTDDKGKFAGPMRWLYDQISLKTGLQFDFVPLQKGTKFMNITKDYSAQIISEFPHDFNWANKFDVRMTKPFTSPYLITVSKDVIKPHDVIAIVYGDYLSEVVKKIYGNQHKYLVCPTINDCMDAVTSGKAAATVLLHYESAYYSQLFKYGTLQYNIINNTDYSMSIAVANSADTRLFTIIQKGLLGIEPTDLAHNFNPLVIIKDQQNIFMLLYKHPLISLGVLIFILGTLLVAGVSFFYLKRIRQKNLTINKQNTLLAEAVKKANSANHAKSAFLSRMSHDMRTPLNGIINYADFIQEATDLSEAKSLSRKIKAAGNYLAALVNDVLGVSRIEAGKVVIHKAPCSYADFTTELHNVLDPKAAEKGVHLIFLSSGRTNDVLLLDHMRLQQIFINLLNNAIKFTPTGGAVTLRTELKPLQGNHLLLHTIITDTGIGMSPEFVQNGLFKAFSQEHPGEDTEETGTGLGLNIVQQLVTLMGGKINCTSKLGDGTTFDFTIPTELVDPTTVTTSPAPDTNGVSLTGKRILLCEDHPMNQEIIKRLLEHEGCQVTVAGNGQLGVEAVKQSATTPFDLILMDIRMPIMNGIAATQAIRALPNSYAQTVPIVAITANSFPEDINQCLAAGMNAHLSKPIDAHKMYTLLISLLHK